MSLFTDIKEWFSVTTAAGRALIRKSLLGPLFFTITGIMVFAGLIIYIVLPPLNFLNLISSHVLEPSSDLSVHAGCATHRQFAQINNQAETNSNILATMKTIDSIGVIINLRDSLLILMCHGVVLRNCPIAGYATSASWKALCAGGRIHSYVAIPFTLATESATIPKIPITVKNAPRDTIAAAKENVHDTCSLPKRGDIAITMHFNNALTLNFFQSEDYSTKATLISLPHFILSGIMDEIRRHVENTIHGKLSGMAIVVSVELSHDDAGILYRAFPRNGKLALFI